MSSVTQAGLCVRTNQIDFDEEVVFAAERAIYDHVRGRDDRPFLMVASLTHPHDPFAITPEFWDLYDHAAIDLPRVRAADVALDPHTARIRHVCAMDAVRLTDAEIRNARHAYYGAIFVLRPAISAVCCRLSNAPASPTTRSWSSWATMGKCSASAGCGTR